MSFMPMLRDLGRSMGWSPGDEEQKARDERVKELRTIMSDAATFAALDGNRSWDAFQKRMEDLRSGLVDELQGAGLDRVPVIQAKLALLKSVASIVPNALKAAMEAREELAELAKKDEDNESTNT